MPDKTIKDIENILINEVADMLSVDVGTITAGAPLHTLGVDSLSFVELLVFIEKKFRLKLMETGLKREDFRTIHSLATCIKQMS